MSRTHKTNPDWVGREWEPLHSLWCRDYIPRRQGQRVDHYKPCDLPDEPPHGPPVRVTWRGTRNTATRCRWWPDLPNAYNRPGRKNYTWPTVTAHRRLHERGIRAKWRLCRQEMLATPISDIDEIELPDPRHRRQAWRAAI